MTLYKIINAIRLTTEVHNRMPDFKKEIEEIDRDFVQSEDIIFLIETTDQYFSSDWQPSQAYAILTAFNEMGINRTKIDAKDRYFIIFYSRENLIKPMEEYSSNPSDFLIAFSQIAPDEPDSAYEPRFSEALATASQMHLSTFRRLGNKTLRIVVISQTGSSDNPGKVTEIADRILKNLGVIVDFVKLGRGIIVNVLEQLIKISGGRFSLADNANSLTKIFNSTITPKKKVLLRKYSSEYAYNPEQIAGVEPLINGFYEKIATDLAEPPTDLKNDAKKCQICFKDACSHNLGIEHLRVCPNCGKPMHLCCAGSWSSQMKIDNPYTFRCPFCFFLLRVPHEFVDESKVKQILSKKEGDIKEIREKSMSKVRKEEDLKKSLLEFQTGFERRKDPLVIFEDWLEDEIPHMNPKERLNIVKEFSLLSTPEQRNEFVNFLKCSKSLKGTKMPKFT
jgi:hypothetical protein